MPLDNRDKSVQTSPSSAELPAAVAAKLAAFFNQGQLGVVLSGGGSRSAYQVGVLKALSQHLERSTSGVSVVVGSSIGAVNAIMLAGSLKLGVNAALSELEALWLERNFRNTFSGNPSRAFLRAIKVAILRYSSPSPVATSHAIFDPSPLVSRLDHTLTKHGGLHVDTRDPRLKAVAVMTTMEGATRKPLLFVGGRREDSCDNWQGASFDVMYVESLTAKHGLASAALPSVLPSVQLDVEGGSVRFIDGGICENVPVDPAVRLGADRVIVVDISGRSWWHDRYGEPHDTRPHWEVPARAETYCLRPPETMIFKPKTGLGEILSTSVAGSTKQFIAALGPMWPIFTILKRKLGNDLAYEVMSYVALDRDYVAALIEKGYRETLEALGK